MEDRRQKVRVEDVLTDSQLCHIVNQYFGDSHWELVDCAMKPATKGLSGFGGDHFRLSLRVLVGHRVTTVPLFVKSVPLHNDGRMKFVTENCLFARENTIFKLIEEMERGPTPYVAKAMLSDERVLVMPDLATEGYSTHNQLKTLDLPHILVALASVARFHAAVANLETKRGLVRQRAYSLMEEHGRIISGSNFVDSPWIHAAAKLSANIIHHLSDKYKGAIPELETNILSQFLAGCEDLAESRSSLNVVLHRDLWVNNIMFKYEADSTPTNAILVDFQCACYGPPAFDVMMLLYVTTSRSFRAQHEAEVLRHYFAIFTESLNIDTKFRLKGLGYDYEEFLRWVNVARRFGMVATLVIFPSVLMDPETASAVLDDPATYERLLYEDRTEVVLAHARRCPEYGDRQLEVTEELVERYLLS